MRVLIIRTEDHDWAWTEVDGERFESGHGVPWRELLERAGVAIVDVELTHEECGEYGEFADDRANAASTAFWQQPAPTA